jgi:thiol-disulfide isomerase/thioredoxin
VSYIKILINSILLIFLVFTLFSGCVDDADNNIEWGNAPDFTLTTINDEEITLSDLLGKVVVIDLMATWCPPCVQQMSQLESVVDEFNDQVVVLSIDVDTSETKTLIINKFGEYTDKWTFMLDNYNENVADKYQVEAIPKIVVISQNGNIYYSHVGYTDYSTISGKIKELLE